MTMRTSRECLKVYMASITRAAIYQRQSGQHILHLKCLWTLKMEMSQIKNDPALCLQEKKK